MFQQTESIDTSCTVEKMYFETFSPSGWTIAQNNCWKVMFFNRNHLHILLTFSVETTKRNGVIREFYSVFFYVLNHTFGIWVSTVTVAYYLITVQQILHKSTTNKGTTKLNIFEKCFIYSFLHHLFMLLFKYVNL